MQTAIIAADILVPRPSNEPYNSGPSLGELEPFVDIPTTLMSFNILHTRTHTFNSPEVQIYAENLQNKNTMKNTSCLPQQSNRIYCVIILTNALTDLDGRLTLFSATSEVGQAFLCVRPRRALFRFPGSRSSSDIYFRGVITLLDSFGARFRRGGDKGRRATKERVVYGEVARIRA